MMHSENTLNLGTLGMDNRDSQGLRHLHKDSQHKRFEAGKRATMRNKAAVRQTVTVTLTKTVSVLQHMGERERIQRDREKERMKSCKDEDKDTAKC